MHQDSDEIYIVRLRSPPCFYVHCSAVIAEYAIRYALGQLETQRRRKARHLLQQASTVFFVHAVRLKPICIARRPTFHNGELNLTDPTKVDVASICLGIYNELSLNRNSFPSL